MKVLNYVQCKGYCAELENGIAGISMIYALSVPNLRDCATDKSFSIALLGHCFKTTWKGKNGRKKCKTAFIRHDEGLRRKWLGKSFSLYNPHIESNSQLVHLNRCILVFDYKLRQLFPSFGTLQNVREDDKNDQGSDSIIDEETRCFRWNGFHV